MAFTPAEACDIDISGAGNLLKHTGLPFEDWRRPGQWAGFGWSGIATVRNKQAWPDWYPPKEMIERQPEIRRAMSELQSGLGMHGGPRNPLGARALYLWQGNKDTLYRIHGTIEPWTIGKNVSSGCIRMINQDVIDLYERTPAGAKVVVVSSRASALQP